MRLRTLDEIERDERLRPLRVPVPAAPVTMADLRPGPVKATLLAIGDALLALPRFVFRLFDVGLGLAILFGLLGCVLFGLSYLFG